MYRYFLKIPWWVRKIFPAYVWKQPVRDKNIYLTFDDGPHPTITSWVLHELKKYEARATFFCIGKNVEQYPDIFKLLQEDGHRVGNHTYSHLNGWKTSTAGYLADIKKASAVLKTDLFRPPYGRIKPQQAKKLPFVMGKSNVKVIMWDVLSADFDRSISPETCARIVLKHAEPGSIVVFHDSEKAFPNLKIALPLVLKELKNEGYNFRAL